MVKDVGLLDKLIGVQIPLNVTEATTATQPVKPESLELIREYMNSPPDPSMTVCD